MQTENRYLVITLGNHDLELALPWTREWLLRRLSGDDAAARSRIDLVLDGTGESEVLREALTILRKDRSFDVTQADTTFERLDAVLRPDIDVVITGHTHLARSLRRTRGSGFYYNSGTWAQLMRLTDDVLLSKERFEKVVAAMKTGNMRALEGLEVVLREPTVVCVAPADRGLEAVLCHVRRNGATIELQDWDRTRHPVGQALMSKDRS